MKIVDVLNNAEKSLRDVRIQNCFYEARILLGYVLSKTKEWIMIHINDDISYEKEETFNILLKKRINGTPLQYIIGMCGFMGNEFFVNESVLIPRADTEVWVEKIIEVFKNNHLTSILDLCTGSGCIAVSLKKALPESDVYAVDISKEALDIARKNAEYNGVNIEFIESDLFKNLGDMKFDIIVSNPPYIPSKEIDNLSVEVLNEPLLALDGGKDGLDFYRDISSSAGKFLTGNGYLAVEFGYNQVLQVESILRENGFGICDVIKDYSGNVRSIFCKKG